MPSHGLRRRPSFSVGRAPDPSPSSRRRLVEVLFGSPPPSSSTPKWAGRLPRTVPRTGRSASYLSLEDRARLPSRVSLGPLCRREEPRHERVGARRWVLVERQQEAQHIIRALGLRRLMRPVGREPLQLAVRGGVGRGGTKRLLQRVERRVGQILLVLGVLDEVEIDL